MRLPRRPKQRDKSARYPYAAAVPPLQTPITLPRTLLACDRPPIADPRVEMLMSESAEINLLSANVFFSSSCRNAKAVSSKRPFLPQRLQQRLHPSYLSEREREKKSKNIPERIRTFFFFFLISLTSKRLLQTCSLKGKTEKSIGISQDIGLKKKKEKPTKKKSLLGRV